MPKILEASCTTGIVTIGALPVPGVTILGEGVGPSTGVVLLQDDEATYIPKTTPDLASTLDSLTSVLTTIASALTAIGAGMTGPTTAPPPTLPTSVSSITSAVSTLTTLRAMLK